MLWEQRQKSRWSNSFKKIKFSMSFTEETKIDFNLENFWLIFYLVFYKFYFFIWRKFTKQKFLAIFHIFLFPSNKQFILPFIYFEYLICINWNYFLSPYILCNEWFFEFDKLKEKQKEKKRRRSKICFSWVKMLRVSNELYNGANWQEYCSARA